MSSPEISSGETGKGRVPSRPDVRSRLVQTGEKKIDDVRPDYDWRSAVQLVEDSKHRQALKTAVRQAEAAVEERELDKMRVGRAVRKSGGVGMSGEVTGFVSEEARETRMLEQEANARRVSKEIEKDERAFFARREESVETLKSQLDDLRSRKGRLPLLNFAAKRAFDVQINGIERKLKGKEDEERSVKASEILKAKETELQNLSAWRPTNWLRIRNLKTEIHDLKRQIAADTLFAARKEVRDQLPETKRK
ncbi:MAG: hypothetical protein V1716_02445 [Candidatus Uhrbacteria bacterium]